MPRSHCETLLSTALIVDDVICDPSPDGTVFDYALITNKQNEYVARYDRVYRHNPQIIGEEPYRAQLLKQNSYRR